MIHNVIVAIILMLWWMNVFGIALILVLVLFWYCVGIGFVIALALILHCYCVRVGISITLVLVLSWYFIDINWLDNAITLQRHFFYSLSICHHFHVLLFTGNVAYVGNITLAHNILCCSRCVTATDKFCSKKQKKVQLQ